MMMIAIGTTCRLYDLFPNYSHQNLSSFFSLGDSQLNKTVAERVYLLCACHKTDVYCCSSLFCIHMECEMAAYVYR